MSEQEPLDPREAHRQRRMAFMAHVEELRVRLMRIVIGVLVGTLVGLLFVNKAMAFILSPMGDVRPVALHPTESIVVYFRVGLLFGLVLAMPYILFELLGFITPGLTKSEKRILLVSVVAIGLFFALGVAFAGMVMLPLAIGYLQGFMSNLVAPTYSIDGYIGFVTTVMFSTGLIFETPLLLAVLARLGVVTSRQLAKNRRFALLVIAVLAAVVTPTPDIFNMMLVMAPLLVLFEIGVILAWFAGRARQRSLAAAGMEV